MVGAGQVPVGKREPTAVAAIAVAFRFEFHPPFDCHSHFNSNENTHRLRFFQR